MKVYLYFILSVIGGHIIFAEIPICSRNGKEVCCSGYRWNETKRTCEECPPGYTGLECIYMCYYPHYGAGCIQKCACPMDLCNFVSGCKMSLTTDNEITGNKVQTSTTGYKRNNINKKAQYEDNTKTSKAIKIGTSSASLVVYTALALVSV